MHGNSNIKLKESCYSTALYQNMMVIQSDSGGKISLTGDI